MVNNCELYMQTDIISVVSIIRQNNYLFTVYFCNKFYSEQIIDQFTGDLYRRIAAAVLSSRLR